MSKSIDEVIDRVRKLLAMSRSDNEHEAAIAADRARQLMAEYALVEAQLRTEDSTRTAEAMTDEVRLDPEAPRSRRRTAWRMRIANAVAKSLGCHPYTMGRETVVFGRESATQAWRYTTMYLIAEVERLCEKAWETDPDGKDNVFSQPKAWRNAFKMGAAQAIASRLAHAKMTDQAAQTARQKLDTYEGKALAIIAKDQAEVDAAYATLSEGWRKTKSIGTVTDLGAFDAGRRAGNEVSLGGERAALVAGQKRLK